MEPNITAGDQLESVHGAECMSRDKSDLGQSARLEMINQNEYIIKKMLPQRLEFGELWPSQRD